MSTHCLGFGLVTCDRILRLDEFPRPNEKRVVNHWTEQIGGPVAVGLMTMAALGLRVHWGLPLGSDHKSERVKSQFQSLGIGYEPGTLSDASVATPEAIILVDRRSGARTVLLLHQVNDSLQQFEQIADRLPVADWVYCDGRDQRFTVLLKAWAKANQAKLFFDFGSLRPNWEEITAGSEIVIVSDDFMRQLDASLTPAETLRRLAAGGVKLAGMTLGREGSLFLQAGTLLKIPAYPAKQVIDTTNAGDVFHGAFLAAWIKTQSVLKSAEFASRCAAWAVGQVGHNLDRVDPDITQAFGRL